MNIEEGTSLILTTCQNYEVPLDYLDRQLLIGALNGLTVEKIYLEYDLKSACTIGYLKTNRSPKFWKKLNNLFQSIGLISSVDRLGRSNIWSYTLSLQKRIQDNTLSFTYERIWDRPIPEEKSDRFKVINDSSLTRNQSKSSVPTSRELPELLEFYGREAELQQLQEWIVQEKSRIAALIGIGGVGKKSLAYKLIEEIQGNNPENAFTNIVWRSLRHAPPIQELLSDVITDICDDANVPVIKNVDRGISQLLSLLRSQRCLLVLDDWEVVLDRNRTGVYQREHSDYGELLRSVATNEHNSCCIIISREMPIEIVKKEKLANSVYRVLPLKGLDVNAASQILISRGIDPQTPKLFDLVQHYQCHPFALQIVANIVQEQFNGNIASLLRSSTVVLDDALQDLLDEQFERLQPTEIQVIYWLAIASRPVTQEQIHSWLSDQPPRSVTISTLESLRRRSLLQIVDIELANLLPAGEEPYPAIGYTLEPVVMKYVLGRFIEQICQNILSLLSTKQIERSGLLCSHSILQAESPEEIQLIQKRLLISRIRAVLGSRWFSQEVLLANCRELLQMYENSTLITLCYAVHNLQLIMDMEIS
ncbi:hypothetical protein H6F42_01610 [Pseudanabaena sp. FACHB-1998]|uniref:NB-ARC domain-containing protein n=1 Tax=Pseudanabaena sp. FACHB-1998 TaxID=2692858 RepID=UPI001681B9D1|nr:NB-ARC domain-containing protein [Pseudanabaena sp. FACHB-1998]MBD2175614.1 hypothetical protein [Pseudanabaena sp. FACHB-1998]